MDDSLADGISLRASWDAKLQETLQLFKHLLASSVPGSPAASAWKSVKQSTDGSPTPSPSATPLATSPSPSPGLRLRNSSATLPSRASPGPFAHGRTSSVTSNSSGVHLALRPLGELTPTDVSLARRSVPRLGEVMRGSVEVPIAGEAISVDRFASLLDTPEMRPKWDSLATSSETIDHIDSRTRLERTIYKLGWPLGSRDSITLNKSFLDPLTLIHVSASLPANKHDPAYLRPSSEHVRANVGIQAWCIQVKGGGRAATLKLTYFWQWDQSSWKLSGSSLSNQVTTCITQLCKMAADRQMTVATVEGFGSGVSISGTSFDPSRSALTLQCAMIQDSGMRGDQEGLGLWSDDTDFEQAAEAQSITFSLSRRRRRHPAQTMEISLSPGHGWDVQIKSTSSDAANEDVPWISSVHKLAVSDQDDFNHGSNLRLELEYCRPTPTDGRIDRYLAFVEKTSEQESTVRVNGLLVPIRNGSSRARSRANSEGLPLQYAAETTGEGGSLYTQRSSDDPDNLQEVRPDDASASTSDESATIKRIKALIERNYIYFTSLLQQPAAKWRPLKDSRGVAMHRLDSIDPTVVVYRAESILVNVSIWDVFAIIKTLGNRAWDPSLQQAVLLDHIGGQSDLWYERHSGSWPVSAHDRVVLQTIYQSKDAIHVFQFSVHDKHLFPSIPVVDFATMPRARTIIKGFSLEQLSPNTAQVTLIERTEPGRWATRNTVSQLMLASLAAVSDIAIKVKTPPAVVTSYNAVMRGWYVDGAAKERFVVEYLARETTQAESILTVEHPSIRSNINTAPNHRRNGSHAPSFIAQASSSDGLASCEIRFSGQPWTLGCDIVVDPPPQSWSARKRSKASGGGITLQVNHALLATPFLVRVLMKGNDTGVFQLNGENIRLEADTISTQLVRKLKRAPPSHNALDSPALSTATTGRTRAASQSQSRPGDQRLDPGQAPPASTVVSPFWQYLANPLTQAYSIAFETSKSIAGPVKDASSPSTSSLAPRDAVQKALSLLRQLNADRASESTAADSWTPISGTSEPLIERRALRYLSDRLPTFRTSRIIQGATADTVLAAVQDGSWDGRRLQNHRRSTHGTGIESGVRSLKMWYPFSERSYQFVSGSAEMEDGKTEGTAGKVLFHVATSDFIGPKTDAANVSGTPRCTVVFEGWILETLDPYAHDRYEIPSTRCFFFSVVDFGVPVAMNNILNAALPKRILDLESHLKKASPPLRLWFPSSCIQLEATPRHCNPLVQLVSLKQTDQGCIVEVFAFPEAFAQQKQSPPSTPQTSSARPTWGNDESISMIEASLPLDMRDEVLDIVAEGRVARPLPEQSVLPLDFELQGRTAMIGLKASFWRASEADLATSLSDIPTKTTCLVRIAMHQPTRPVSHPLGNAAEEEQDTSWLEEARRSGLVVRAAFQRKARSGDRTPFRFNEEGHQFQDVARSPQSLQDERSHAHAADRPRGQLQADFVHVDSSRLATIKEPESAIGEAIVKANPGTAVSTEAKPVVGDAAPAKSDALPKRSENTAYTFWPLQLRARRSNTLPPAAPSPKQTTVESKPNPPRQTEPVGPATQTAIARPAATPISTTFVILLAATCLLIGWSLRPVIQDLTLFAIIDEERGSAVEIVPLFWMWGWQVVARRAL